MHSTLKDLKKAMPSNWLQAFQEEYLTLLEKTLYTVIQLKAAELKWGGILKKAEDFSAFFASEGQRLHKSPEEIRGFFYQIAQFKTKETLFERHYGDWVARDEQQNPLIPRKELEQFVHQAKI